MINFPFLTLLLILPLIGVGLLTLINGTHNQILRNARAVTLWTTSATFLVVLVVWFEFDPDKSSFQLIHHIPMFGGMGIDYLVGVDGVSLLMLMLTTFLMPLIILAGWSSIQKRPKVYYIALLCMETFIIGAFISLNVLMFYIFFEGVLIPMFLLIGIWGGENRIYATFKFFLYTFSGSILVLIAFLVIGSYLDSFNLTMWPTNIESLFFSNVTHLLWWALFIGFAIKIPMIPLHTWLPDAHVEAPATASMILAGILLKLGGYAMIRFHLLAFPILSEHYFPMIAGLSVLAIVYASLLAWVQADMKKLVAYSSIAHMGYVVLGIYSQTPLGIKGAVIQMVSHGVISAGLFYVVDILYRRIHTRDMHQYGGVVTVAPKLSVLAFVFVLGLISLPVTSGFVGEIMVTLAVFQISQLFGVLAVVGVLLAPLYGLTFYRKIFLGLPSEGVLKIKDITLKELSICSALLLLVIWLGVYPKTFINVLDASVMRIIRVG
jgi:NADH-quinone oxidoreductase subunit M